MHFYYPLKLTKHTPRRLCAERHYLAGEEKERQSEKGNKNNNNKETMKFHPFSDRDCHTGNPVIIKIKRRNSTHFLTGLPIVVKYARTSSKSLSLLFLFLEVIIIVCHVPGYVAECSMFLILLTPLSLSSLTFLSI